MLTERLQAMLDRNVADSPRARELLARLNGKRLRITARFTPWQVTVTATANSLLLSKSDKAAADAELSGTPMSLMQLLSEPPQDVIRRGSVQLTGDSEAATLFQELAALLRPDVEAELARVVGDVPAFGAGQLLRRALKYGRSVRETGMQNVGEYLTHERRELIPKAEARPYLDGVDQVREATDRLSARITRLEASK
jgi:ubiquinone biosynthesis accessory factor UbiJ